jgi:hypothetical protein
MPGTAVSRDGDSDGKSVGEDKRIARSEAVDEDGAIGTEMSNDMGSGSRFS